MNKILRFLLHIVCVVVMAAAFLVGIFASCMVAGLLIARFQEGGFYPPDQQMLGKAAMWLAISSLVTAAAWWLHCRYLGHDESFRLVETRSPRTERLSFAVFDILGAGLLSFWLWAIIGRHGWLKIPIILGWLAVAFMGMHLRIFFHELAHLVAARIVSFNLRRLQVGVGPVLMARSSNKGFWFEWRLLPRGGFMAATPPGISAFRLRQSVLVAAGPIADVLMLFGGYKLITALFGSIGRSFSYADGTVASALFFWTLSSAITGVLPIRAWVGSRRFFTDGYILFRLWTASNKLLTEWASLSDWRKALELLQSTDRDGGAAREADPPVGQADASSSESLQTLEAQRNRLASEVLRQAKPGSPSA